MHEERRKAYRFPVLQEQESADLRVGDAEFTVRLLDQSATGFSVLAENHPGVYAGEMVWLKTKAGWASVRVVKVRHSEEGTRIGLERLADAPDPPKRERSANLVMGDGLKRAASKGNASIFLGWGLAFAAIVAGLMWASTLKSLRIGSFTLSSADSREAAVPSSEQPTVAAEQDLAAKRNVQLQQAAREFGATMMGLPDVARQLQLTPEQQRKLREVLDSMRAAEENLRSKLRGGSRSQLSAEAARLHEQANQEALSILTPEQQARWQEMVDSALKATPDTAP